MTSESFPGNLPHPHPELMSGWGCYPVVQTFSCAVKSQLDLREIVQRVLGKTSVLARGAGRSYGDAAVNSSGVTIVVEGMNKIIAFDKQTGELRAEAGASIKEVLEAVVQYGWILPVIPGTKNVTIGGAIASDIHGKNHYLQGSFSRHLEGFELITGNGQRLWCSREDNPAAFWATVGGMGLTGIISEVRLRLVPLLSRYIKSHCLRTDSLPQLFEEFAANANKHDHAIAWIDCMSLGSNFGRGIFLVGDHEAHCDEPAPSLIPKLPVIDIPFQAPGWFLNPLLIKIFNQMYFQFHNNTTRSIYLDQFFFPLDSIGHWNRLYGSDGFVQYQFYVPFGNYRDICELLTHCAGSGHNATLVTLKQLGPAEQHREVSLSFPDAGYTLAIDFARKPGLAKLIAQLDQLVIQMHGRVYLAKDSCLTADAFRQMYPQWKEWLTVRDRLDPEHFFCSALSKRLELA